MNRGDYVKIKKESNHGFDEKFLDSVYYIDFLLSDSVFIVSHDLGYRVELFVLKKNLEVVEHGVKV